MKNKHYSVKLTRRAQIDLEVIQDYTFQKYGRKQVLGYSKIIFDGIKKLEEFPEFYGHFHEELPDDLRTYKVGEHNLIYRIENNTIYILAILHGKMNISEQLDKLN